MSVVSDPATAGIVVGALALILLGAAWQKFSEPNAFLAVLAAYRVLPQGLLGFGTRAIPTLEVAIGVGLLVPNSRNAALVCAAALFVLYALGMVLNLVRGRGYIDCGCGGAGQTLSWGLVLRNAVLAGVALAVSGPTRERSLDLLDGFTLVLGALAFYFAYQMADELLRQSNRMARSLEQEPQP